MKDRAAQEGRPIIDVMCIAAIDGYFPQLPHGRQIWLLGRNPQVIP